MVTKCANPTCGTPFHYLRGGRLYSFELRAKNSGVARQKRLAVYFWICDRCAESLSLEFDPEQGVFLKQSWENAAPPKKLQCDECEDL